ncbi:hypothetical protein N7535_005898 [Penicillium sp. DV-2018c]|nr:hypothetical protein N7535_005898 [Penicillium sp. DV-2018c]
MTFPATLARITAQVHITGTTMPKNLSESRLLLATLQKFGEVITYRNLKYDTTNKSPNLNRPILAIFETADAAERAIAASPITIPVPLSSLPTSKLFSSSQSTSEKPRSLVVEIQSSRHNHASALKRSPFYSTYNLFKDNPIYQDLMSEETGIPLKELADTLPSKKYSIGPGVKDNIQAENRRMGAASLMDMWREGMGIETGVEGEGSGDGENGYVRNHGGVGIREPDERVRDHKDGVV